MIKADGAEADFAATETCDPLPRAREKEIADLRGVTRSPFVQPTSVECKRRSDTSEPDVPFRRRDMSLLSAPR
jgi:hypothetical protein